MPWLENIHLREGERCVGGWGGGLYYYSRPCKSATSKLVDTTDNAPVVFTFKILHVKEQPALPLDAGGKARRRAHQSLRLPPIETKTFVTRASIPDSQLSARNPLLNNPEHLRVQTTAEKH